MPLISHPRRAPACAPPRRIDGEAALRHASRPGRARPASLGLAARARGRRSTWPPSSARPGSRRCGCKPSRATASRAQRARRAARHRARVRRARRAPRHGPRRAGSLRRRRRRGRPDRGRAGAARRGRRRARTIVFASWDGEEAWSTGTAHDHGLARVPAQRWARRRATWSPRSTSRCAAGRTARPSCTRSPTPIPLRPGGT